MKQIISALIVCNACLVPIVATAAEPPTKSVRVTFAELDLQKEAGVRELYSRLRRASREVCGNPHVGGHQRSLQHDNCFEETLDSAVTSVGIPMLARIHGQS